MTIIHRFTRHKTRAVLFASALALSSSVGIAGVGVGSGSGGSGGSGMSTTSGIADREISRRLQRVQEAQNAINKGDKLLADGDPEGALNEYKTAIDLLPEAPATQAWRDLATAKYCDASVALAKQRAKSGRYADAKALLNESLSRNADHLASKTLLKQLDDPERYEPALTPEHVKNVEDVNRNLKLGSSFENLGDHDAANKSYQDALRIDKYNSAARRNMEKVEQEKANYFEAARDHTRAKMLNDVNKAWEDQVPLKFENLGGADFGNAVNASRYYTEKMQRIIFPTVQFQGASIDEAIEFLRIKSKDLDTIERDPTKRGVNLILKQGQAPSTAQISLDLHDVPMVEALRYITELAGMKYKIEPYAVLVVPVSDTNTEQYSRTFKVPPDFLSMGGGDAGGGGGAGAPAAPIDPFAPKAGGGAAGGAPALLGGKGNALEILKANGIPFPEGSSAVFIAATSQLIVKNTQPALDAVENFVDSLNKKVPQQIYITTKFVEVSQRNTDELGFDWLLGQFNTLGSKGVFGGGGPANGGNSLNGPQVAANYPFLLPGVGSPVGSFPVTAGNRSGSAAITPNAIDGLLSGATATVAPTPGVFALSGVFTDPQFQLVIRALSQKKGVDLMTAPSVTTRSGQRANIEVVREFIYPTEFNPPQIPTNVGGGNGGGGGIGTTTITNIPVTPTTPTAFTMRPVGVRMEVDPVIGPDGFTIDLNLAPEVTEFEGFINYGSPIQIPAVDALGNPVPVVLTENRIPQPVFSVRKITTAVTVWDGQTVAMGGLIREDVQEIADKVPILGDLPIVGRLFQNKSQDHFKRNLMIFVTAKLIDPSGQPVKQNRESSTGPAVVPAGGVSAVPGAGGVLPPIN